MPLSSRTVRVTVKCTKGEFRVTVRPWAAKVKPAQRVEWIAGGKVTDLRIRKHSRKSAWPFDATPAKSYTATHKRHAKSGKLREFPHAAAGKRIPYTIDLRFADDQGKLRSAEVDPDMVIDS